jgi:hypothetical protein
MPIKLPFRRISASVLQPAISIAGPQVTILILSAQLRTRPMRKAG